MIKKELWTYKDNLTELSFAFSIGETNISEKESFLTHLEQAVFDLKADLGIVERPIQGMEESQ